MNSKKIELEQFNRFYQSLDHSDFLADLQGGLIGEDVILSGPNGNHTMIYADYAASGRALRQIETFVADEILPYYANSHTEASYCGQLMSRLRRQARQIILDSCGGDDHHAVIFTGSGATAGINRLVGLLGVNRTPQPTVCPVVLLGPYEHHSNILPWRESGAEVIEISEALDGGPDLEQLESALKSAGERPIIGAFSAASNVTGIITDVKVVTRLLKSYSAISVWDYAGGGPYLPIDMGIGTDAEIDAIVVSPHKYIGGPGASGVMILRKNVVKTAIPTSPGGGTVSFVSPWVHDYSKSLVAREEAGTPNVIGDIRAALCFMVKDAIGQDILDKRLGELRQRALNTWKTTPGLQILGNPLALRSLPIFSFRIEDPNGGYIHQQLITRMLSDIYGIQARGGCACAGPYAHRLLNIGREESAILRKAILGGREIEKPGWTRLGFSVLMDLEKADKIIHAVDHLARNPYPSATDYLVDETTAKFSMEAF